MICTASMAIMIMTKIEIKVSISIIFFFIKNVSNHALNGLRDEFAGPPILCYGKCMNLLVESVTDSVHLNFQIKM